MDSEKHIMSEKYMLDPFLHRFTFLARRDPDSSGNTQKFLKTTRGAKVYENVLCAVVENSMGLDELKTKVWYI